MTDAPNTELKPTSFYLGPGYQERLTAIAATMTRQLGVKVTRSAAVRRLIDDFFTSHCSSEYPAITETHRRSAA
jgi:hypothetical protein